MIQPKRALFGQDTSAAAKIFRGLNPRWPQGRRADQKRRSLRAAPADECAAGLPPGMLEQPHTGRPLGEPSVLTVRPSARHWTGVHQPALSRGRPRGVQEYRGRCRSSPAAECKCINRDIREGRSDRRVSGEPANLARPERGQPRRDHPVLMPQTPIDIPLRSDGGAWRLGALKTRAFPATTPYHYWRLTAVLYRQGSRRC